MKKIRFSALLMLLLSCVSFTDVASAATKGEAAKPAAVQQAPAENVALVNLNTADVAQLQSELKGIGEKKAEAIVQYREANGPFTSVDQLLEVKGIGKATLDKNREKLTIK
ncbi:competence protein ComEA helix-hairpin-helix repeat region [compost metagenome]|uniref:Competence protein ComEA n=1 Tax=Pseudomonas jinjuensis TaxID=198616 RepID=A0A1G9YHZ6_9PSED|nr:ComEA family DNA-binding protein [Pseudomonas jinjuensis]SDN08141.1 competence protein ComEA [Pseudomonas jinjuensis]